MITVYIEPFLLAYIKEMEGSSCIANPNEPYNDRDFRNPFLCNCRLVFYTLNKKKKLFCILLERGINYLNRCYLLEYKDHVVVGVAAFDTPDGVKKYKRLKKYFKRGQYQYVRQAYRIPLSK